MTQHSLFAHLPGAQVAPQFQSLEDQAKVAECWETPAWAARAILQVELLTPFVFDPCCGTGVIADAAIEAGHEVIASDRYDWGYTRQTHSNIDFLVDTIQWRDPSKPFTVLMNPPFSLATQFVDRAFDLGARKVVCFQRQAWRESIERRAWWDARPPARVWLCGNRATCWLFTVPPEERRGGTDVAHAWYVWERGHRGAELTGTIWKDGHRG